MLLAPPLAQMLITSPFGWRTLRGARRWHDGVDFRARSPVTVYSSAYGIVVSVNRNASDPCGLYVKIDHGGKVRTLYCHLSEIHVAKGDLVSKGMSIGKTGSTGTSVPHLHYRVQVKDGISWKAINPVDMLPGPIPLKSGGFVGSARGGMGIAGLVLVGLAGYFIYQQVRK